LFVVMAMRISHATKVYWFSKNERKNMPISAIYILQESLSFIYEGSNIQ
jgi:hypothetical protein